MTAAPRTDGPATLPPDGCSAPLKIAMATDFYLPRIGGIEFHLRDLSTQLALRGHRVEVITTIRKGDGPDTLPVRRIDTPLLPFFHIAFTPGMIGKLERTLREHRFDVVHCHFSAGSPMALAAAHLCHKLGIPTVLTFHSLLGGFLWPLTAVNRWLGWSRWPIVFSAVSPEVAADVRAIDPGVEFEILPNGVERARWQTPRRERDPDRIRIVSVMRLCVRKRPRVLLDMMVRIREAVPPPPAVELKVVGPGILRASLERQVRRLGLEGVVEFLGYREREFIRDLHAESDIYVLPSILEAFGIAALEARCAGLPVVTMRHGGAKAFIRDGVNGFLAETDQELIERVVQLVRDPALRAGIADRNRDDPPPMDWGSTVDRHVAVYRKAIRLSESLRASSARTR